MCGLSERGPSSQSLRNTVLRTCGLRFENRNTNTFDGFGAFPSRMISFKGIHTYVVGFGLIFFSFILFVPFYIFQVF